MRSRARQFCLIGEAIDGLRCTHRLVGRARFGVEMGVHSLKVSTRRRHEIILGVVRQVQLARDDIIQAFAVLGEEGVQIHYGSNDALGHELRSHRDRHATIGVADEQNVLETLVLDDIGDIEPVHGKIDGRARQVRALAKAGERRREHKVTAIDQQVRDVAPAPTADPCAVNDDNRCTLFCHFLLPREAGMM